MVNFDDAKFNRGEPLRLNRPTSFAVQSRLVTPAQSDQTMSPAQSTPSVWFAETFVYIDGTVIVRPEQSRANTIVNRDLVNPSGTPHTLREVTYHYQLAPVYFGVPAYRPSGTTIDSVYHGDLATASILYSPGSNGSGVVYMPGTILKLTAANVTAFKKKPGGKNLSIGAGTLVCISTATTRRSQMSVGGSQTTGRAAYAVELLKRETVTTELRCCTWVPESNLRRDNEA